MQRDRTKPYLHRLQTLQQMCQLWWRPPILYQNMTSLEKRKKILTIKHTRNIPYAEVLCQSVLGIFGHLRSFFYENWQSTLQSHIFQVFDYAIFPCGVIGLFYIKKIWLSCILFWQKLMRFSKWIKGFGKWFLLGGLLCLRVCFTVQSTVYPLLVYKYRI